jgi:predicted RNase H-like HicB family nuclease
MRFMVILRPEASGRVAAVVPALPGVAASGDDRESALHAITRAVEDALGGGEVVTVEASVGRAAAANPWTSIAGAYADDPTWDEFIAAMRAARTLDEGRTGA